MLTPFLYAFGLERQNDRKQKLEGEDRKMRREGDVKTGSRERKRKYCFNLQMPEANQRFPKIQKCA